MPRLQFGANAYEDEAYNLPKTRLENWYAQAVEGRGDWAFRLVPTPGLVRHTDIAGGAGRGVFQSDAVAGGETIYVVGAALRRTTSYGVSTPISGAVINDERPARFAVSQSRLVVASGGRVYAVNASTVNDFTASLTGAGASGAIADVDVLNNRHLFVESGSGRLFYSNPGTPTLIGGFVTAESDPDQLKAILVVNASAILFGSKRTEFWVGTESATRPLIPRQGFVIDTGILATAAKTQLRGAAYWVANNNKVYEWAGGREVEVSAPWIESKIRGLTFADKQKVRMSAHTYGGAFVSLSIPGAGDYFFDVDRRTWHRRKPLGNDTLNWGYDFYAEADGSIFVQALASGHLMRLSDTVYTEDGEFVHRVATALVPLDGQAAITNMVIEGQPGVGLDASFEIGSDPQMSIRVSRDGRTFEGPIIRKIGRVGDHRWRPVVGTLGTFREPVGLLELSYSDPVGWIVYGASYNRPVY